MGERIGRFVSPEARDEYFESYREVLNAWLAPDAELDVETSHGTTRVYRYGQGDAPPVVLLHGLGTSSAVNGPILKALARRHPVYAFDRLGEPGRSVPTRPFKDVAEEARCRDEVMAALGLTGVHLVGLSTGGWVAFQQAVHAPGRLATLTLLDPTCLTAKFSTKLLVYGAVVAILNREWLWRRLLAWMTGTASLDRPDIRLVRKGLRAYRMAVPMQVLPEARLFASVTLPVYALFAGRSVAHDGPSAAKRARELMPHAEVELWPEAPHDLSVGEDPDRVTDRVLDFLGRHSTRVA